MTHQVAAALPRRALLGSAAGKAIEALTLAGLVLLVPRALGPADYGAFAVGLAVATGAATATGIGGPALFARVLAPLDGARRRDVARALALRIGRTRAGLLAGLAATALVGALLAPGELDPLHVALVGMAAALGTAATLLSQLALGLERTAPWSLRYPLENGVIVVAALALYSRAGLNGALAAAALAPLWALANQLAAVRERAGATVAGAAAGAVAFAAVALLAVPGSGASGAAAAMLAGVGSATAATFEALRRSSRA